MSQERKLPEEQDTTCKEPPLKLADHTITQSPDSVEDTHASEPVSEPTRLMAAVLANDILEVQKHLHEVGKFTKDGETALMLAAKKGITDMVPLLIAGEANMQDDEGYTALMYAACYDHANVVALLITECGKQTHAGWTALMCAVFHNSLNSIPILLSESSLRNKIGYTARDLAQKGNRMEAIQLLITQSNPEA